MGILNLYFFSENFRKGPWNKQIGREPLRGSRDLFVPRYDSFPMNPETRAPRGTDRSPEYNEYFCNKLDSRVKNLTKEWNEKHQHFITHASRSLLWIQFVAVAFQSEEENFWRGPCDLFCLALDPPLGRYGQNISMHVPGHEHFIPTKFRKHPLSRSVVKADYVFPYINIVLVLPPPPFFT